MKPESKIQKNGFERGDARGVHHCLLFMPAEASYGFASFVIHVDLNSLSLGKRRAKKKSEKSKMSETDVREFSVLKPETRTYLINQLVKDSSGKVFGFISGTLNLHFLREPLAPPSPSMLVEYWTWWRPSNMPP